MNAEKARQEQAWAGEGLKSPTGGNDKEVDPEKMILFAQDDFKNFNRTFPGDWIEKTIEGAEDLSFYICGFSSAR